MSASSPSGTARRLGEILAQAAGGTYEEPYIVTRIVGPDGRDVPLPDPPPPRRVMDEAEAYIVTHMLTSVIDHGTGVRAKSLGRPLAGKTGTSNGPKDTWFAGYSADVVAVVWVGYDDGRVLGGSEQGAVTADYKADREVVISVLNDALATKTGKLPYTDDTDTVDEVFLAGTEPTAVASSGE